MFVTGLGWRQQHRPQSDADTSLGQMLAINVDVNEQLSSTTALRLFPSVWHSPNIATSLRSSPCPPYSSFLPASLSGFVSPASAFPLSVSLPLSHVSLSLSLSLCLSLFAYLCLPFFSVCLSVSLSPSAF